jgi:peptide/nickel transport system permease protein
LYIRQRLLYTVVTLFGVSILLFSIIRLVPGDPASSYLGIRATAEIRQALISKWGFDKPIYEQYARWLVNVLQGDLGTSTVSGRPAADVILERLPVTIELTVLGILINVLISVPAGIIAATKQNSRIDIGILSGSLLGVSMPDFWMGIILILIFSAYLNILPPSGFVPLFQDVVGNLRYMILPSLSLALVNAAENIRNTRSAMLEVLRQDYVRFARAKGLPERLVIYKHAFRNALVQVVTVLGLQIGRILGGVVVIENIFTLPGMGSLFVMAFNMRDYAVVQGVAMYIAILFLFSNLVVDVLYMYMDPRIRVQ